MFQLLFYCQTVVHDFNVGTQFGAIIHAVRLNWRAAAKRRGAATGDGTARNPPEMSGLSGFPPMREVLGFCEVFCARRQPKKADRGRSPF